MTYLTCYALNMAHGSAHGRRSALLLVLVAAALAFAATFTVGCGSKADKYVGYWSDTIQGQPAGQSFALHITRSGDQYVVDMGAGEPGKAQLSGGKLEITLQTQTFELTPKGDQLQLATSAMSTLEEQGVQPLTLHRIDATQFAAAREGWQNQANDAAVREGIHSIQIGIQTWAVDHNDTFPPARVVAKNRAVGTYVDNWPTNPFTKQPMHAGTGPGDYQYTSNGKMYKLIGLGSDSKPVITVP